MAAPSNAEQSPELTIPLKIPKTEVPSPAESEDLSDGNQYHSNASTPSRFSPLNVGSTVSGAGSAGRSASAASAASNSYTACRGMSWTPSETNALIAVWGNERLTEARMQQLEVAGTVFSGKAPGPAMYERVSRALSELGYERTPSQCRERMKTLRRCYSRVKEHGIGKRKSSYSLEQLEKVFGQGGWDSQTCQPVLINSSGLYQDMESDGSTMEEFSQEDWCNQELSNAFQEGDEDTEDIPLPKARVVHARPEPTGHMQRQEVMQNVMRILESVDIQWEHFQTWTDFSRLHLSNKLAIFGVGYNTRWRPDVRYHHAEISSQVPLGKRLREYFNPEKAEGRVIMTKVQKMNWKNVYYKFLDITISEARCLELHMEVSWIPVSRSQSHSSRTSSSSATSSSATSSTAGCSNGGAHHHYLLPGGIPKTYGLYAIGYEELGGGGASSRTGLGGTTTGLGSADDPSSSSSQESGGGGGGGGGNAGGASGSSPNRSLSTTSDRQDRSASASAVSKVTYCYLGIAEDRTLQQCLYQHFHTAAAAVGRQHHNTRGSAMSLEAAQSPLNKFLQANCSSSSSSSSGTSKTEGAPPPPPSSAIYIKFIEVELDFLSAGSLVECLEIAVGYKLKYNKKETL